MPIDESPRLTRRVTITLCLVMFLVCLAADRLKCRPGKAPGFCIGWAYTHPCPGIKEAGQRSLECPVRWDAFPKSEAPAGACAVSRQFLLYTLEVMPSDARDRQVGGGLTIGSLLTEALMEQYAGENSLALNVSDRAAGGEVGEYMFASDSISFPYRNRTADAQFDAIREWGMGLRADDAWLRSLEQRLPLTLKRQSSRDAMRRHFPALDNSLNQLYKRHHSAGSLNCARVSLIVVLIINPSVYLDKWVSLLPFAADGKTPLTNSQLRARVVAASANNCERGFQRTARVLHNLLLFKRQYRRILARVRFLPLPLTFPGLHFTVQNETALRQLLAGSADRNGSVPAPLHRWMSSHDNESRMCAMAKLSRQTPAKSAAVCEPGRAATGAFPCGDACGQYRRQAPLVSALELDAQRGYLRAAAAARRSYLGPGLVDARGRVTALSPNCYAPVMACGKGLCTWDLRHDWPGEWSPLEGAGSETFDDCLRLTPSGGRALARCLAATTRDGIPEG